MPNLASVSKDLGRLEYRMFPDNCKVTKQQQVNIIYNI